MFFFIHAGLKSLTLFININFHNALAEASTKCCLRSATSQTGIWYSQSCITLHIRQSIVWRSMLFRSHKFGGMNIGVLRYSTSSIIWCAQHAASWSTVLLEENFPQGSVATNQKRLNSQSNVCKRMYGTSESRGNVFNLDKRRAKYDLRKYYFTNRMANAWNSPPDHVVLFETIHTFKSQLDKF